MQQTDNYSRVISGTMTWGSWGEKLSKKEMVNLMHHCIENGLTTFDFPNIYMGVIPPYPKINLEFQDWFALLVASYGHDVP